MDKVIFNNIRDGISLLDLLKEKFGIRDQDIDDTRLNDIVSNNLSEITDRYQPEEQDKEPKEYIKFGTKLDIPDTVFNDLKKVFVKRVRVTPFLDVSAFWGNEIKEIHNDEKYAPRFDVDFVRDSGYQKRFEFATVYAYSKVLKAFVNLSDFIMSVSVSNSGAGHSFNLELPSVTGTRKDTREFSEDFFGEEQTLSYDVIDRWSFISENFELYKSGEFRNYYYKGSMYKQDGNNNVSFSDFIFHMILSQMDMVWIKFERIQLEDRVGVDPFLEITVDDINKHYWDCIGFIDENSISYNVHADVASINITGRGYNKLFLDDGVYYFPFTINDDPESGGAVAFANSEEASKSESFSRLVRVLDVWQETRFFSGTTVASLMDIIVSQASTIKVVDDNVLNGITGAIPKGQNIYGAWRLFKLLADDDANRRILVNSSFATNKGSLWSFISGLCTFPFLEVFQDTYGTQNYMIVRKPPLTRKAWENNTTINIPSRDLIELDASFETSRIYSWFRLLPQAFFAGDAKMSEFFFPAIFLPEYAEIWGSRPLEITSNYLDYGFDVNEIEEAYEQIKADMETFITVNAYMPFIRSGQAVIIGNRTIRRGMNIRFESTGEVYHVTGVSNNYANDGSNVNRATVVSIDRGMVETEYDRYFKLVNFGKFNSKGTGAFKWDVNVNTQNFQYLLEKRQFGK